MGTYKVICFLITQTFIRQKNAPHPPPVKNAAVSP